MVKLLKYYTKFYLKLATSSCPR